MSLCKMSIIMHTTAHSVSSTINIVLVRETHVGPYMHAHTHIYILVLKPSFNFHFRGVEGNKKKSLNVFHIFSYNLAAVGHILRVIAVDGG